MSFANKTHFISFVSEIVSYVAKKLFFVNSNPNDAIMELLITSYALKTSCANRVVGKSNCISYLRSKCLSQICYSQVAS